MEILGICGSPRKTGSTTRFALGKSLEAVRGHSPELKTRLVALSDYSFSGCRGCNTRCREGLDCALDDDYRNRIMPLLAHPEVKGLILASPVYFGSVSAQMKAFIDRSLVFRRNNFSLREMVAGPLTVGKSRHGGQELAALDLVKFALIQAMIVVGDAPPTSHFGSMLWSGIEGGIQNDSVGQETAVNLGTRLARTVLRLHG